MNHDHYENDYLRGILRDTKTIALVGASHKPERPSHGVMRFLQRHHYKVTPVNPGLAGQSLHGQTVAGKLSDIPGAIDMVDIFRNNSALPALADEILALPRKPKVVWMQLGVRDDAQAARLEAAGIKVVMNRCPAIEIPRLGTL